MPGVSSSGVPLHYPVIHRRKVPFRPHIEATEEFAERAARIRQLDSELERFFPSLSDYLELVEEAYASNIHFSTKLEGNPLPLADVRRLTRRSLRGQPPEKPPDFPAQEIINHLILWLAPGTTKLPWSIDRVTGIHRALLMGVSKEARPGLLRNHEAAIYSDQGQEVFKPCPPGHVREELESLLDWTAKAAPSLDPIVGAAVLFHEFESIHPFSDGNGRVGRTLFHAYLQHRGLPNAHLCLLEKEVLQDPEEYYNVLGYTDQEGSYERLLDHFSRALLRSYEDAVKRFGAKEMPASLLPETLRRLLLSAKRHREWFSVAEAARWTQGVSEQTIRNHLNELVQLTLLDARGNTRAKRYRFAPPLAQLQRNMQSLLKKLGPKGDPMGLFRVGRTDPTEATLQKMKDADRRRLAALDKR